MYIYKTIDVDHKYNIIIGKQLISNLSSIIDFKIISKVFIITDEIVAHYHLKNLEKSLNSVKYKSYVLSPGEESKNYQTAHSIIEQILSERPDRNSAIIALGGGVIGDIGGFIASVMLRGIYLINIPTSLLAQVDSSIGGKNAVNSVYGKNLIGTFYNPFIVIIDVSLLESLKQSEFILGMAEVVKYGIISDEKFFIWLEQNIDLVLDRKISMLMPMIYNCCLIKSTLVAEDFNDKCEKRILLNFGHTFAHALESASEYNINHGDAVSVGMIFAAMISNKLHLLDCKAIINIRSLLQRIGLLCDVSVINKYKDKILFYLQSDKKLVFDKITLVLLNSIGKPVLKAVKQDEIKKITNSIFKDIDVNT